MVEPPVTFKYTTWASSRMFPSVSRISDTRAYSQRAFRSSRGNAVGQVGSGGRDVRQRTGLVRHELAEGPIESLSSTVNPSTAAIWPLARFAIDRRRWVGLLTPSAATTAVSDPSVSARS